MPRQRQAPQLLHRDDREVDRGGDVVRCPWSADAAYGESSAGSTTTSAPHAVASARRPAEKSLAITVRTPRALSGQITARPIGPQPMTIATVRFLTSPRRTACQRDRHRLGQRGELGRQPVGHRRASATPRRASARRSRPGAGPRARSRAPPSPRRSSGSATTGVPSRPLAEPRAVLDDLAAELVADDDLLVGAHEVVVAGLRDHVGELVAVVARVQVRAADAAAQHVEQHLALPGSGAGRSTSSSSASLQATAFMRLLHRQHAAVDRQDDAGHVATTRRWPGRAARRRAPRARRPGPRAPGASSRRGSRPGTARSSRTGRSRARAR